MQALVLLRFGVIDHHDIEVDAALEVMLCIKDTEYGSN